MSDPVDAPVQCARAVLQHAVPVGRALRGFDGEWQIHGSDGGADMVTTSFGEVVTSAPHLAALSDLPIGVVANWDESDRVWALESFDMPPDDDCYDAWVGDWGLPFSANLEVYVTEDLAEIEPDGPKHDREVVRVYCEESSGDVVFEGASSGEESGVVAFALRDIVALYPNVRELFRLDVPIPAVWDGVGRCWRAEAMELADPPSHRLYGMGDIHVRKFAPHGMRDMLLRQATQRQILDMTLFDDGTRAFMRGMLRVPLNDGRHLSIAMWVEISLAELARRESIPRSPARQGMLFRGVLANSVEPWGSEVRGASVTTVVRDHRWIPEIVGSDSELVQRMITETWDHRWVSAPYRDSPEWHSPDHGEH